MKNPINLLKGLDLDPSWIVECWISVFLKVWFLKAYIQIWFLKKVFCLFKNLGYLIRSITHNWIIDSNVVHWAFIQLPKGIAYLYHVKTIEIIVKEKYNQISSICCVSFEIKVGINLRNKQYSWFSGDNKSFLGIFFLATKKDINVLV
jgi:hypothetical protein